jgi:hypothetical protein
VAELGKRLKDPWFRSSFARDARGAMKSASLEADDIDPDILGVLSELTPAELRVLATVGQALQDAGISPPAALNMV